MSLKTTPRGLLAALAAVCIVTLQLPAVKGSVASAASAGAPRAAAPAHHAVASHAGAIRPHTIAPGSTEATTFVSGTVPITGSTASLTPITGPVGTVITVTGSISPSNVATATAASQPVTVSVAGVTLGVATAVSPTERFTVSATLPLTLPVGTANVTAAYTYTNVSGTPTVTTTTTAVATLPFGVNAPTLAIAPAFGPHCTTVALTGTNFAPGVPISPTIVFSNGAGITATAVLTSVTPISNGTAMTGDFTATAMITTGIPYSTTSVISVAATYPVTPAYPTFTVEPRPTLAVSPVGAGLTTGPLGPFFTTGTTNTLNVVGGSPPYALGNTTGTFLPNTAMTFTVGLSGTAGSAITPSSPVTTDANGIFTTTIPFNTALAGTYVLTATEISSCNVATTTFTVVSATVPGPPVSTTYFAEGYTGAAASAVSGTVGGSAAYSTTLAILNPNVVTVLVTDTYLLEQTSADVTPTTSAPDVVVVTHTLGPLADMSVNVANDIASQKVITGPHAGTFVPGTGQKVATIVQTAGFQEVGALVGLGGQVRGVAAERIIERTPSSGPRDDGDVSLGTTSPNTSYYFAEGYTGSSFQEYLLLVNPSPTVTATVSVIRVPEGTATTLPPLGPIVLAPYQRLTINVNRMNAGATQNSIGLIVNSADNPFVAERVLYFGPGNGSAKPGETVAAGLTTAAKQLNFAYGSLTGTGDVTTTIPPSSDVAQSVDDRPFVEVMNPNIAGQVIAGSLSGSATAPGPSAHVTIQLRGEDGRLLGFFITDVDAGARFTLTTSDLTSSSGGIGFPGVPRSAPIRAGVFSAVVSSSERVVAEEAQYYGQGGVTPSGDANSGAPGAALVGAPTGETDVLFPALSTTDPALVGTAAASQPLSQTVFLYNPGVNTVRINGTFYGATGVVAHQVYSVGPDQIAVIGTISSTIGGAASGSPIPAGTLGAEFSTIQQRGVTASGEPAQAPETFVAAAVTHSADGTNWWGTQGLYPLPVAPSCSTTNGAPLPGGCP